jgi:hypothetical protein
MADRKTARPPFHAPLGLAACALALSLAFASGARAQDDDEFGDGDEDAPAPLVIDIEGPCILSLQGQSLPCREVAYMVFPSNHRIDFTAITDTAGWAFSGEEDDDRDGRYALALDSVLNAGTGRIEADGRCEMVLAADHRTVTSLDCRAKTEAGEFTLRASGNIEVEETGNDEDDGPDDIWDDSTVS